MPIMTGSQVRMARAALRWSISDLAQAAGVGISTVQRVEAADDPTVHDDLEWRADARTGSVEAIRKALVAAGITFLPDDGKAGVGLRCKAKGRLQLVRGK